MKKLSFIGLAIIGLLQQNSSFAQATAPMQKENGGYGSNNGNTYSSNNNNGNTNTNNSNSGGIKRKSLTSYMNLQMPETDGRNGACVAYHQVTKRFYASYGGNEGFPMAVFDIKGSRLSDADLKTSFDTRGLWYNPNTKSICANGYNQNGWIRYKLDYNGMPTDKETLFEGLNQPSEHSVGVYCAYDDKLHFLNEQNIDAYSLTTGQYESQIRLYVGVDQGQTADESNISLSEDYNKTSIIYTGIMNAQFGLLNITDKQIELYDRNTGYRTQILKLPSDITLYSLMNFCYANGTYFLFNKETNTWMGYR
jgi:hypothetical protein